MASNYFSKGLKRSALTLALGLCFAGGVNAQSTSGDISGNVPASSGGKVTLTSTNTGITREYAVDAAGRFRISSLPSGGYDLTLSDGTKTHVNVVAGATVTADFSKPAAGATTTLDAVTVLGGSINAIDLQSTEVRTTFVAEQLNTLPVARDVTSVSLLTPGTAASSSFFGPASFGGASAAENSYYVNGFNTTNLYDSLSFSEVPFQAIDQLDVQTGGYGAKYGFSTGGVTSVNVKRGTNEFKGGVSYTWTPNTLREQPDNVALKDGSIYRTYGKNEANSSNLSLWAGGPIVKDKLFFFGLMSYSRADSTSFGGRGSGYSGGPNTAYSTTKATTASDYSTTQPYWLLKLDWYLNDNNHIEYTGFDNTRKSQYNNYQGLYSGTTIDSTVTKTTFTGQEFLENGGHTDILKWTSYLTENLTMALQWGRMDNTNSDYTVSPAGVPNYYFGDINVPPSCPYVLDYRPGSPTYGKVTGCTTVSSVGITNGYNKRDGARIDFEWQLGDHRVAFGYSQEKWKSRQGAIQDIQYMAQADDWLVQNDKDPLPLDASPIVDRIYFATGGNIGIDQRSWYLEDNWNVTDTVMLYGGIRNDSFTNKNSTGATFVQQSNIWQPRFGITWDVLGNGDSKLFATAGRYSLPIAANVSLRAASRSYYTENIYSWDGHTVNPANGAPVTTGFYRGGVYNAVYNGEDGSVPDPNAVAGKGLKPYTQDEYILGYQQMIHSDNAFLDGWQLGVKGTFRDIVTAIDDTCDSRALYNAAKAQGYSVSNWANEWTVPGGIPGCYMYNPGSDLSLTLDVNVDGHIKNVLIPAAALGPKAQRDYKALTFSADKTTETWSVSASYTWSRLYGNLEGLVKSTNGQADTGTTSDFDFKEIMYGSTGHLFNEHEHVFKIYGSYSFGPQWAVGYNFLAQSGIPKSCLGGGLDSFGTQYGYTGVFHACDPAHPDVVTPVGQAGRTPWIVTFSPNVIWTPKQLPGLSVQMSVINLFNQIEATQNFESRFGITAAGAYRNYYNYDAPRFFSQPRYVRFQVQYDF